MIASNFYIKNQKTQLFFTTYRNELEINNSIENILVDHKPSLVATLDDARYVIKFVKARSWHEYIKLLWNHSRITKEVKGTKILKDLGLNVPRIHRTGLGILPSFKYKFIGYYIMENLAKTGFKEVSKLVQDHKVDSVFREELLTTIQAGLTKMRENNIVFSDFHLDNVFSNKEGRVVWIDAGVTRYNSILNSRKFHDKWNDSIYRLQKYLNKSGLLTKIEREIFDKLLII